MIKFHSEHPADEDVFPGGSHEKVAGAMRQYICSPNSSRVIGLDGEFGSGKSSILQMLKAKLVKENADYRVWFFDCEQNYQGSTKSNFIELFTDVVLKDVKQGSSEESLIKECRDKALGRQFTYKKKTTSRLSAWAIALVVSVFFSSTSFKEIFTIWRATPVEWSLLLIHLFVFLTPLLVVLVAWYRNRDVIEEDGEKWSLLSLFKGSTDDTINEKIVVAKEVTPLDLKRTLTNQLRAVADNQYVVILDNLDRLPKDSLRAVWSDLEIFTSVAEAENLTVVVPFCSSKVAAYLRADADRTYDSKDFIAKKFPVVFRSPPVIASGWKDGFRRLWSYSYDGHALDIAEHCALLLQRHSPMVNSLVTPRLQKKFINDIATTSLVVGERANLLCIAAYLLLCKYTEHPLNEVIRTEGFSKKYAGEAGEDASAKVQETIKLLTTIVGNGMESGWQIQLLQIHFLTSSEIAIAELLDSPLQDAFASHDEDKLFGLVSLFGFIDAFKRLVATRPTLYQLLPTLSAAHKKHNGEWLLSTLSVLNNAKLTLFSGDTPGDEAFYDACKYCVSQGMDANLLSEHGVGLRSELLGVLNDPIAGTSIAPVQRLLVEYDWYLDALNLSVDSFELIRADYIMRLLPVISELRVITAEKFALLSSNAAAYGIANQQIGSCEAYPMTMVPLESPEVERAVVWAYGSRKLHQGIQAGIPAEDVAELAKLCGASGEEASVVIGLALAKKIDPVILSTITSLLEANSSAVIRAVAAIIYIRQKDAAALSSVPDVKEVIASSLFRALGAASLSAQMLFDLLEPKETKGLVGGYLAHLIKSDKILSIRVEWIAQNFSSVTSAVSPYGIGADEVLRWLNPWDSVLKTLGEKAATVDRLLIDLTFEPGAQYLSIFRRSILEHFMSAGRTVENWIGYIEEGSPQYRTIIKALGHETGIEKTAGMANDAVIQVINDAAGQVEGGELTSSRVDLIDSVLTILDMQQKLLIGVRLRSLLYSDSVQLESLMPILNHYGKLIPDVQPTNPQEVGRLVMVLDHIARHPSETDGVANLFDSKAGQIADYKYSSKELREAVGSAVLKVADRMPALHEKFAQTRGFVKLLRSLSKLTSATDAK